MISLVATYLYQFGMPDSSKPLKNKQLIIIAMDLSKLHLDWGASKYKGKEEGTLA